MRAWPIALLLLAVAMARPAAAGPVLLFDPADGRILYSEDADDAWYPASLTKIMTAYLTFEAIRDKKLALDTKITMSENAAQQPPSKIGLPVGATLTVEQALKAVIIKSANDVAVMLAEAVGEGSQGEFVARMNRTAARLGMTRTQFVNPNGLPAAVQVTSARDLGRLARAVLHEFPLYANYWSMPEARIGKIRLASHNGLLHTYDGADGMKTGFICDSGFNVVATASRDGRQLIAVVLGESSSSDRTLRAAGLLEHGFQSGGWKSLVGRVATIDTEPLAPEKPVTSVRKTIKSWDCGGGPPRAVAGAKAKPKQAKADSTSKPPAAGPADGVAQPPAKRPRRKPAQAAADGGLPVGVSAPPLPAPPAARKPAPDAGSTATGAPAPAPSP